MNQITPSAFDERDFISPEEKSAIESTFAAVSSESIASRPNDEADSRETAITTDLVFDMFAALVPDSPWSHRLLKIRDLFNTMGSGIAELMDNPHFNLDGCVYDVREREGEGWDGPAVKSFSHAVSKITEAHVTLNPVRTDGVS